MPILLFAENRRATCRTSTFFRLCFFLLAFTLTLTGPAARAADEVILPESRKVEWAAHARDDQSRKIAHLLNRIAYGPSPTDVERVRKMGIRAYIEAQLDPSRFHASDNTMLEDAIDALFLEVLPGSGEFLVKEGDIWHYHKGTGEPPGDWMTVDFDDSSWPVGPSGFGYGDDDDKTILEDMQGGDGQPGYLSFYARTSFEIDDPQTLNNLFMRVRYDDGFVGYLNGQEVLRENLEGNPPEHRHVATVSGGTVERGAPDTFDFEHARSLLRKGRNVLAFQIHNHRIGSSDLTLIPELAHAPDPPARALPGVAQLQQLMHLRGIYAERQLQAVLAEFWENHFCTDFDKVEDYIDDLPDYERKQTAEGESTVERQIAAEAAGIELAEYEFFHQHALGYFGDLLLYSATSPSMLIYLDSVLNVKAEPNENYAREILELYSFGVDNRYTQQDIEALAKCFTGWTIRKMTPEGKLPFPLSARIPPTSPSLAIQSESVLLDLGPGWKYFKGEREPSPGNGGAPTLAWTTNGFDDHAWLDGTTGIGYGDGDDATVLSDMVDNYVSVYLRRPVSIELPDDGDTVQLEIAYDDGYVAYLNGVEIGRSANVKEAGNPPPYDYIVERNHEVNQGVDSIDLGKFRRHIKPPPALNTLALQVHNGALDSSDFSILPRILKRRYKPGSIERTDPLGVWVFRFDPEQHDPGEKVLFRGSEHEIRVPAGRAGVNGVRDALDVIDAIAAHPSTSEFVVIKLVNKFVSDEISLASYHDRSAPQALVDLVDEAIVAWKATPRPGHIATVMKVLLDPERQTGPFWSDLARAAKVKTPIEFVNSCFRALDAKVEDDELPEKTAEMGMALFQRDDPDGYDEFGQAWMNTHNLLERLRFCQALAANGDYGGGRWSLQQLMERENLRTAEDLIAYFDAFLFQGRLEPQRKSVFLNFANTNDAGEPDPVSGLKGEKKLRRLEQMVGLILSAPEFQFQ